MVNYDICIMKNNIKSIMEKKNIKQVQLAEVTGIPQPQISSVLNPKNSNSFTIIQLVNIANYLNCSVDEILGFKKNNQKKEPESLSDILRMIFEIDTNITINIGECGTGKREMFLDVDLDEITVTGFYFDVPAMKTILTEWNDLKKSSIKEPLKSKIIKQWQGSILKEYKKYRKEWGFRNELEQGEHLAKLALKQCYDNFPLPQPLSQELNDYQNQKILYKYINDLDPTSEYAKQHYDRSDLEFLFRYEKSCPDFTTIPDDIEE